MHVDDYRAHCDTFTQTIRDLCHTPATRVVLERGRGRPVEDCDQRAHRALAPLTRGYGARRAHWTVAGLIALERPTRHPLDLAAVHDSRTDLPWYQRPNLGTCLAQAAATTTRDDTSAERRLRVLTRLSTDLLHRRLPGLTRQLLSQGQAPDFAVWLSDLAAWDEHRRAIATRWLDSFHLAPHHHAPAPPLADPTP